MSIARLLTKVVDLGQAMGLNQTSQVGQSLMGQSTMSNMTNPSMLQYPQVFQGQMAAAQQVFLPQKHSHLVFDLCLSTVIFCLI